MIAYSTPVQRKKYRAIFEIGQFVNANPGEVLLQKEHLQLFIQFQK
jgi:hypothetical protein